MESEKTQTTVGYIWLTDNQSQLGSGATGTVYRAMHKHTGRKVAAKVIKNNLKPLFIGYTQKEVELLRVFDHPNIVKFIGDEELRSGAAVGDQGGVGSRVVLLELCEGGTVQKLLQDATNRFGLPDKIVLGVLRDITAALRYLQTKRIIHRDIKSDNILIAHSDTGACIYKLTDFGGSYQSEHDTGSEEFSSVFGTLEVMHPDMLEKGAINRHKDVTFDVGVDLWSFGVVLYHMSTGRFPFIPYRGRADKDTLFRIVSQKSSGHISGCDNETGQITWNKALPDTGQLSHTIKSMLTTLIARLLEGKRSCQMTREELFEFVANIPQLCVPIVCAEQASYDNIYVAPSITFDGFKLAIQNSTNINVADQCVFVGSTPAEHIAPSEQSISSITKSYNISKDNPIVVMPKVSSGHLTFSKVLDDEIDPEIGDPDADGSGGDIWKWARQCVAVGHLYERHVTALVLIIRLDLSVWQILTALTDEAWQPLDEQKRHVCQLTDVAVKYERLRQKSAANGSNGRLNGEQVDAQHLQRDVNRWCHGVEVLYQQYIDMIVSNTIDESIAVRLDQVEKCAQKARHVLNITESSAGHLREQRNQRLSHNMRQRRTMEMRLIHRQTLEIKGMFQWIKAQVERTHSHALKHYHKCGKFRKKIHDLKQNGDTLDDSVTHLLGIDAGPSVRVRTVSQRQHTNHSESLSHRHSSGYSDAGRMLADQTHGSGAAMNGSWVDSYASALTLARVSTPIQATEPEDMEL